MICSGNEVELLQTKASSDTRQRKASTPLMHMCTHALLYDDIVS